MTDAVRDQIGVVGGGAVAAALARALEATCEVLLWARRPDAVEAAHVTDDLAAVASRPTVLVAVTDDALAEVSEALRPHIAPGAVVLHTSGARTGASAMPSLERAVRGSLHPLVAVPRGAPASIFQAMPFVVEAERAVGVRRAEKIVARLGGELVRLPNARSGESDAHTKARYHALATMVATGVVALVDRAAAELAQTAAERAAFRTAFGRLAASAAANVLTADGAEVLTGPMARGDRSTLDLHAATLSGAQTEHLYAAVRRAAETMLRDAREGGA